MRNHNPKKMEYRRFVETVPKMRYDGSMSPERWQQIAREKLRELLGFDFMEQCEPDFKMEEVKEYTDFTEKWFSFQSEPGYYVPGCILIPKEHTEALKPMICIQGHSKGMHISLGRPKYDGDEKTISGGDRDYALRALANGYCPVMIEQRYMGVCGGDAEGPGCCAQEREGTASALPTLLLGRCAIGERVWDVCRLIDIMEEHFPELDSANISCMGNSGGGTVTFYASCIDQRIRNAVPSCAVCSFYESIVSIHHCACNYVPQIARYFDMGDLGGLIAPRRLVVVAGKEDPIFPMVGVKKAFGTIRDFYKTMDCEEKVSLVIGEGGHRFYASLAYGELNRER